MKILIQIEKEITDKYDLADIYFKLLYSLANTSERIGMRNADFNMLIASSSFSFLDDQFRYPTLTDLKDHFERLCENYWSHKSDN